MTQEAFTFVPATPEDAPKLALLAAEAFAEDALLFGQLPPGIDKASEHARMIRHGCTYKILVNGILAGGMVAIPKDDGIVWIHVIYVLPRFQNQGIGTRALAWLEAQFPDAIGFELETPDGKSRNLHVYLRAGYVQSGRRQVESQPGLTLIRMRKRGLG